MGAFRTCHADAHGLDQSVEEPNCYSHVWPCLVAKSVGVPQYNMVPTPNYREDGEHNVRAYENTVSLAKNDKGAGKDDCNCRDGRDAPLYPKLRHRVLFVAIKIDPQGEEEDGVQKCLEEKHALDPSVKK